MWTFIFGVLATCLLHTSSSTDVRLQSLDVGNWTVGDCIRIEFAMEMIIHSNSSDPNQNITVTVPTTAQVKASDLSKACGNETNILRLTWTDHDPKNGTELSRDLKITFEKNETKFYGISRIEANFTYQSWNETVTIHNPDNTTENKTITLTSYFYLVADYSKDLILKTPLDRSYLCANPGEIELDTTIIIPGKTLDHLSKSKILSRAVQFDAFRDKDSPKHNYRTPLDCEYQPNDIVPIVVGCALAGLVIVVLVAYLVGRRKNRQRGYQSV